LLIRHVASYAIHASYCWTTSHTTASAIDAYFQNLVSNISPSKLCNEIFLQSATTAVTAKCESQTATTSAWAFANCLIIAHVYINATDSVSNTY
jgi:hypothetical protein